MSRSFTDQDERWMARALRLAARGQGRVEPNPMVGCVLVRGGRIVGEGYHRQFGGPHAEVHALRAAGPSARGATAYVTLEPCCHYGKTPPCTDALIAARVRRVVIAMRDSFPPVSGRGLGKLKSAGIEVAAGMCEQEAQHLNAPYIKLRRTGRPWVILKWAQSLDGKIATYAGDSRWISSEDARRWVHRLRARVDVIIVGVGTVVSDDPRLDCRGVRPKRIATRVVLDPDLRTPLGARLVRTAREIPTLVVAGRGGGSADRERRLNKCGVEVLRVPFLRGGGQRHLDLGQLLDELGRREMTNVMVEGGGKTLGAFFDSGLADEAIVFVSRRLIGGSDAPAPLQGFGRARMSEVKPPAWTKLTRCGEDDAYQLLF